MLPDSSSRTGLNVRLFMSGITNCPAPVPATPIPRVTMRVASRIGAPSSQGTVRERLGIIAASSVAAGSDSRFEATIHLSAVEYERMMQANDDDEVIDDSEGICPN